jgi:hypothetical protein
MLFFAALIVNESRSIGFPVVLNRKKKAKKENRTQKEGDTSSPVICMYVCMHMQLRWKPANGKTRLAKRLQGQG